MKKIFVPLTLERVGSEGKFFTDNTILKLFGTVIAGVLAATLIFAYLGDLLPSIITWVIALTVFFLIVYYLGRYWVLRERQLFKLLQKLAQHKLVNVGEFADVYDIDNDVCLHNSGYMSAFLSVVRGTTLGMTEQEKYQFYAGFKAMEDNLLASGYSFKVFNYETPIVKDTIFKDQRNGCRECGFRSLENNLNLKNTYTKAFMEACMRDEGFVYVIITEQGDIDHFKLKIEQAARNVINKHIKEARLLHKDEIMQFATEYCDVQYFEFENDSEEDIEDFLTVIK